MMNKERVTILGSTGSIGVQTLDIIRRYPERFQVSSLVAHSRWEQLAEQAREFKAESVVIGDEQYYDALKTALADTDIKVMAGSEAINHVSESYRSDTLVNALVGYAGLHPTLLAIESGKRIALANKETLVVAGELITALCKEYNVPMLPVDSEHSAIFQSLMGEESPIEKLILTASGGPFRKFSLDEMKNVTAAQALKHPNWDMGAKITIDSASMMNKGFEVIEAKWLFDVDADKIQVVVHPQSIVHSAVQFQDGAVKAQLGAPDMRVPIQLAMSYPIRLESSFPRIDWWDMQDLTFERPDLERFPCLAMAYEAIRRGGNAACVVNAANEVVNLAFRQEKCGFLQMAEIIQKTLDKVAYIKEPTLDDYLETDRIARLTATEFL